MVFFRNFREFIINNLDMQQVGLIDTANYLSANYLSNVNDKQKTNE